MTLIGHEFRLLEAIGAELGIGKIAGSPEILSAGRAVDSFSLEANSLERLSRYLLTARPRRSTFFGSGCAGPLFFLFGALVIHIGTGAALYSLSPEEGRSEAKRMRELSERLIAEARNAINIADLRHSQLQPRLGGFIIDSEALSGNRSERETKSLHEKWEGKIAQYAKRLGSINDPHEKISRLMTSLYWDFWYSYKRDNRNLCDFITEKKGNCVAQTKLAIAAISELGIVLPKNEGIGVQLFGDHMQPVHFSRDSNGMITKVTNLVTGGQASRVVAPIYHPAIFHLGLLRKHGVHSIVSFDDLLIAFPAPGDMRRAKLKTRGYDRRELDIELPETEAVLGIDPPMAGTMMPPVFGSFSDEVKHGMGPRALSAGGTGDAGAVDGSLDASGKSAVDGEREPAALFSEIPNEEIPQDLDFRVGNKPLLAFRTEELRQRYYQLSSEEEVAQFLLQLTKIALIKTAKLSRLWSFLANPYREMQRMSVNDLRAVRSGFERYYRAYVQGVEGYSAFMDLALAKRSDLDDAQKTAMLRSLRLKEFPGFYVRNEKRRQFIASIQQEPRRFVLALNSIKDPGKRPAVLDIVEAMFLPLEGYAPIRIPSLVEMLKDPRQTAIAFKRDEETQRVPPPMRLIWIDADKPLMIPSQDVSQRSSKPEGEIPKIASRADLKISAETMVQLIIAIKDVELAKRWDAHLTESFKRMNANGELNNSFKICCWRMIYDEKLRIREGKDLSDEAVNEKFLEEVDAEMDAAARDPAHSAIVPAPMARLLSTTKLERGEFGLVSNALHEPEEINSETN